MEQLDPQLVNLAKAIRQTESGGDFGARGKSGEYGAYQYTTDTWLKDAKDAGVYVALQDATPEQQNEVAYKSLAKWKREHPDWNVGNFASAWNAGEEHANAYLDPKYKGTNKEGANYDVPAYAKSVATAYHQIKNGGQAGYDVNNPSSVAPSIESGFVQPPQLQPMATGQQTTTPQTTNNGGLLSMLMGGATSVAKGLAEPLLGLAATPVQAGIAGYNALTGSNVQDPYKNGIPVAGLGQASVTPLNAEQKAGDLAQTASLFIPGSGILSAAGAGALQGAGAAMSRGEDASSVATKGAIGGVLGGGVAAGTKAIGAGIQYAGEKLSGEHVQKAAEGIKEAYGSALNLNAGERAYENRSGKDLAEVLMQNQVPLSRYADGTLDASKAIPKLQEKITPLSSEAESILSGSNATINLIDAANKAKAGMAKKATTALDMRNSSKEIDEYIQAEIEQRANQLAQSTYGQALDRLSKQQQSKIVYDAANIPVLDADKIKTGFWNATFDKTRSDLQNHIPYQIGTSIKDSIEKAVPDSQLAVVNKELGNLIDATRRLTKMDGVKLLRGRLGNIASGAIGALTGAATGIGPLGVLAGDYFGQKAGQFLQDPATKIAIAGYKAGAESAIPRLLGPASKVVGKAVSAAGSGIAKSSRAAGLIGNLLTK